MSIRDAEGMYRAPRKIRYESPRYPGKTITVPEGYESDGATGAFDICSDSWWVHDVICDRATWDDGTPINAWQAAAVLSDILASEGRWARAIYWRWTTYLIGCHKTRKNGGWLWPRR